MPTTLGWLTLGSRSTSLRVLCRENVVPDDVPDQSAVRVSCLP